MSALLIALSRSFLASPSLNRGSQGEATLRSPRYHPVVRHGAQLQVRVSFKFESLATRSRTAPRPTSLKACIHEHGTCPRPLAPPTPMCVTSRDRVRYRCAGRETHAVFFNFQCLYGMSLTNNKRTLTDAEELQRDLVIALGGDANSNDLTSQVNEAVEEVNDLADRVSAIEELNDPECVRDLFYTLADGETISAWSLRCKIRMRNAPYFTVSDELAASRAAAEAAEAARAHAEARLAGAEERRAKRARRAPRTPRARSPVSSARRRPQSTSSSSSSSAPNYYPPMPPLQMSPRLIPLPSAAFQFNEGGNYQLARLARALQDQHQQCNSLHCNERLNERLGGRKRRAKPKACRPKAPLSMLQLKAIAKKKGHTGYSRMRRADLERIARAR